MNRLNKLFKDLLLLLPVHALVLGMLLSDWGSGLFSPSNLIVFAGLILLIKYYKTISKYQYIVMATASAMVFISALPHLIFDTNGVGGEVMVYWFKFVIYLGYFMLTYNYIKQNKIEARSLGVLVGWAVAVSLVGFYITWAITSDSGAPYQFFWEYTRQDVQSYTFRGGSGLIRSRSIMSEPQHLGLFLNMVLALVLFSNTIYRPKVINTIIISIAAVSTFSFATLPVTALILGVYFVRNYGLKLFTSRIFWFSVVAVFIALMLIWDAVYITVIQRSMEIISGNDGSSLKRLFDSWSHIDPNRLLVGNGIGQTPSIWNNFAYVLSDLGLVSFVLFIYLIFKLFKINPYLAVMLAIFSSQKGGYLSFFNWAMIILMFAIGSDRSIYGGRYHNGNINRLKRQYAGGDKT